MPLVLVGVGIIGPGVQLIVAPGVVDERAAGFPQPMTMLAKIQAITKCLIGPEYIPAYGGECVRPVMAFYTAGAAPIASGVATESRGTAGRSFARSFFANKYESPGQRAET